MYHGKYAARKVRGRPRDEWDNWHRGHTPDGLHQAASYEFDGYSPAETEWLAAVDAWKVRRGPVIRAAELLSILDSLGYRCPENAPGAAALDAALETERRRRAAECGRRARFLTACEVLALFVGLGWRREG